jgi:CHAT domain-containing protein
MLLATASAVAHATPLKPATPLAALLRSGEEKLQRLDFGAAEESFAAALQLARESADRGAQATARRGLGRSMPIFAEGEANARLALSLHRELKDEAGEVADLLALSENYQARGYFEKAQAVLPDALAITRRLRLQRDEIRVEEELANVQRSEGDYEEALSSLQAALKVVRRNGAMPSDEVRLTTALGDLAADLGRYEEAESYLKASILNARRLHPKAISAGPPRKRESLQQIVKRVELVTGALAALDEKEGDPKADTPATSDPELLPFLLAALADDLEEQSRRLEEVERDLTSLDAATATPSSLEPSRDGASVYRLFKEGYARQAEDLRRAQASGKLDDRAKEALATAAKGKRNVLAVVREVSQALSQEQGPSQAALAAVGCELEALTTLSRMYQELGEREAANARIKEGWELRDRTPALDLIDFHDQSERARKLAMPGPISQGACSGYFYSEKSLWSDDLKAAEGHPQEAIRGYLSTASINSSQQLAVWTRIAGLYAAMGAVDKALEYYRKAIDATETIQRRLHVGELVASWSSHQEPIYAQAIRLLYQLDRPAEAFEYAERARARAFLNQIGSRDLPAAGVSPELRKQLHDVRRRLIEMESLRAAKQSPSPGLPRNRLGTGAGNEEEAARKLYQALVAKVSQTNPEYASLLTVNTVTLEQVQKEILDDKTSLIEYFILDDKVLAWVIDREGVSWHALPISAKSLREQISYLRNLIATRNPSTEVASALHEAIFAPLEPYLRHRDVIVVPQGPLHFLPFGALWNAKLGRFVAQDYALTLAPSASVLRFIQNKENSSTAGLLALGDPDGSLPEARTEVREIARLFDATPWVGPEALESRLYGSEGSGAGIIHLAAHATYDPARPFWTHLELTATPGSVARPAESDGKLHVFEIYGLNLKSASLVVLSACNSALGARDEGDDLIGLPRAFLYAGAPAVLTTLWRVADEATAILMQRFYERLRQGAAPADALSRAQRDLLEQPATREPYFWAGFTLTGTRITGRHP